jgi:hypothetical protein
MIETNETGQRKLNALVRNFEDLELSDWEREFLASVIGRPYYGLTRRQKDVITDLFEKYL